MPDYAYAAGMAQQKRGAAAKGPAPRFRAIILKSSKAFFPECVPEQVFRLFTGFAHRLGGYVQSPSALILLLLAVQASEQPHDGNP